MTLDDRTFFIEYHTQIWNLQITFALHTSKHDLGPRSTHKQCSPSTYELQTIKPNVWFVRERLRSHLRLTKAQTLTADTGSSSLATPAHCVSRRKNHHSASPRTSSRKIQNRLRRESHVRRSKFWQPTMRERLRNMEAMARLRAGGDGALCAGTRRGKKTLNRKKDKKDKIGGLTSSDWRGLGSYLLGLTLERGNLAKQRQERATHCRLRGQPS